MKILDINPKLLVKDIDLNSRHATKILDINNGKLCSHILSLSGVQDFSYKSEPIKKVNVRLVSSVALALLIAGGSSGYWIYKKNEAEKTILNAGYEVSGESLRYAIQRGDVGLLPAFSRLGVKVSTTNNVIESALLSRNPDVLEKVLSEGAKFDSENNLKLFFPEVINQDNPLLLATLISHGALASQPAFGSINISDLAAKHDKWEIIKWIVNNQPKEEISDADGNSAAHYFVLADSPELIESAREKWKLDFITTKNSSGDTPLHIATRTFKPKSVEALLKIGADALLPNQLGINSLQQASLSGNDDLLSIFATGKADVTAQLITSIGIDTLVDGGYQKTISALVNSGVVDANTNLKSGGTILSVALIKNQVDLVKILLEKGANPNTVFVVNGVGNVTPLMIACIQGVEESVVLLLKVGAKKDAVASNGLTPLIAAEKSGNSQIIGLVSQ